MFLGFDAFVNFLESVLEIYVLNSFGYQAHIDVGTMCPEPSCEWPYKLNSKIVFAYTFL